VHYVAHIKRFYAWCLVGQYRLPRLRALQCGKALAFLRSIQLLNRLEYDSLVHAEGITG